MFRSGFWLIALHRDNLCMEGRTRLLLLLLLLVVRLWLVVVKDHLRDLDYYDNELVVSSHRTQIHFLQVDHALHKNCRY